MIKVYPNPAMDLVTLEYQLSDITDQTKVIVIDEVGQQVYSGAILGGQGSKTISVSSWSPGLYLYKVISEKGFFASGSFVVNH
jgi:hypothetical protein